MTFASVAVRLMNRVAGSLLIAVGVWLAVRAWKATRHTDFATEVTGCLGRRCDGGLTKADRLVFGHSSLMMPALMRKVANAIWSWSM